MFLKRSTPVKFDNGEIFFLGHMILFADCKFDKLLTFLLQWHDPLDPILLAGKRQGKLLTFKLFHLLVVRGFLAIEIDKLSHDKSG